MTAQFVGHEYQAEFCSLMPVRNPAGTSPRSSSGQLIASYPIRLWYSSASSRTKRGREFVFSSSSQFRTLLSHGGWFAVGSLRRGATRTNTPCGSDGVPASEIVVRNHGSGGAQVIAATGPAVRTESEAENTSTRKTCGPKLAILRG